MEICSKPIYMCSYCRKIYKMKYHCKKHEMQCWHNPNNKHTCYDCRHLDVDRKFVEAEGEGEQTIKTFYCQKLKIDMHTCKAEARGFARGLNTFRMPIECKDKEYSEIDF